MILNGQLRSLLCPSPLRQRESTAGALGQGPLLPTGSSFCDPPPRGHFSGSQLPEQQTNKSGHKYSHPPYPWFCLENSRSKQFIRFKWYVIMRRVMKSHAVLLRLDWTGLERWIVFVQQIPPLSLLVAGWLC